MDNRGTFYQPRLASYFHPFFHQNTTLDCPMTNAYHILQQPCLFGFVHIFRRFKSKPLLNQSTIVKMMGIIEINFSTRNTYSVIDDVVIFLLFILSHRRHWTEIGLAYVY